MNVAYLQAYRASSGKKQPQTQLRKNTDGKDGPITEGTYTHGAPCESLLLEPNGRWIRWRWADLCAHGKVFLVVNPLEMSAEIYIHSGIWGWPEAEAEAGSHIFVRVGLCWEVWRWWIESARLPWGLHRFGCPLIVTLMGWFSQVRRWPEIPGDHVLGMCVCARLWAERGFFSAVRSHNCSKTWLSL